MTLIQTEPKKIYIRVDQQGWQPGANTYLYYPLDGDANDHSGNNRNLTTSNLTYTQFNGYKAAVLANNIKAYYNIGTYFSGSQNFTISFYARFTALPTNPGSFSRLTFAYDYSNGSDSGWDKTFKFYNNGDVLFYAYYSGQIETARQNLSLNTWYNIIGTFDGTKITLYVNGVSIGSAATTSTYACNYLVIEGYNNEYLNGNISNFIIENKCWTAQEVSDYYDITKSLYGIN